MFNQMKMFENYLDEAGQILLAKTSSSSLRRAALNTGQHWVGGGGGLSELAGTPQELDWLTYCPATSLGLQNGRRKGSAQKQSAAAL